MIAPCLGMRLLAAALLGTTILVAIGLPPAPATAAPAAGTDTGPILFVFDTSGSMGERDDQGVPRLEGAKSATVDVIYGLPVSAEVGVWSYPGDGDCGAGGSVLDVDALDVSQLTAKIQQLQPGGNTPTAAALRAAADSLRSEGYQSGTIVLVSDGLANCADDPCDVAKQIRADGFDLTVETTGFNIDPDGREQLECIADATGGSYVDIGNSDDLLRVLQAATRADLELRVTGLDTTARAGSAHTITASLHNASASVTANSASVGLSFGPGADAVYPAVLPPRKQLGNIPPGETATATWRISTGIGGIAYATVLAQATDLAAVGTSGSITISSQQATLSDAGSILRDAERIAIIGDSFSAGEGSGDYIDADSPSSGCHRSFNTYAVGLYGIADERAIIACSGAVTSDFLAANPGRQRSAQRDYVFGLFNDPATAPQAVLLTFGGNDIGFAGIVQRCAYPFDCTHDNVIGDAKRWVQDIFADAGTVRETLAHLYRNIDNSVAISTPAGAPRVPIIVLPYVQIITNTVGDGCSNMNNNERRMGVQLINTLNASVEGAVVDAHSDGALVYFAKDVTTALLPGHTACADNADDRYVNALDFAPTAAQSVDPELAAACSVAPPGANRAAACGSAAIAFGKKFPGEAQQLMHPNAKGYQAITNALVDWSARPEVEEMWQVDRDKPIDQNRFLRVVDAITSPAFNSVGSVSIPGGTSAGSVGVSTGGQLQVQASGFAPGSEVRVVVRSNPVALRTTTADDEGSIDTGVTVPINLARGQHTLSVEGYDAEYRPVTFTQPIDVHLATPWWVVAVGVMALLALGAGIALQVRARRTRGAAA